MPRTYKKQKVEKTSNEVIIKLFLPGHEGLVY